MSTVGNGSAPWPASYLSFSDVRNGLLCRKRPFTTHADGLRPRLEGSCWTCSAPQTSDCVTGSRYSRIDAWRLLPLGYGWELGLWRRGKHVAKSRSECSLHPRVPGPQACLRAASSAADGRYVQPRAPALQPRSRASEPSSPKSRGFWTGRRSRYPAAAGRAAQPAHQRRLSEASAKSRSVDTTPFSTSAYSTPSLSTTIGIGIQRSFPQSSHNGVSPSRSHRPV